MVILLAIRKFTNRILINSRKYTSATSKLLKPIKIKNRKMSNQAAGNKGPNRLALEKSPYLLQHANNPVDWYPWCDEAFQLAVTDDKPIFLSIGYSTCHWCHVMEKESFENESTAEIMNKYFINIKVDREERPDIDKMYMSYIQAIEGHGGWPMSIFLTSTLEPIAGATYLPPDDRYGRPSFKTYLLNIAKSWKEHKAELLTTGKRTVKSLENFHNLQLGSKKSLEKIPTDDNSYWNKCVAQLLASYDYPAGGFSLAPKFPQPTNFNFLFHFYAFESNSDRGKQCRDMCLNTLKRMAYGGIHDHVNNGFARYSVDGRWHVPHFEKMLYDQAQLVVSYCDAYIISKDEFYADIARDILTYVSRDLSHPCGGFYGAQDADSYPFEGALHKTEGAFCVWEYNEIANILSDYSTNDIKHLDLFIHHYNVKSNGNVNPNQDPHGELTKKNVLACFESYESTAMKFNTTVSIVKEILQQCHQYLNVEREKRPKPDTDYKIVTSWNGLMISAYAKAGFTLNDQSYIERAIAAARFLRKYSYNENEKTLLRCCYRGDENDVDQVAQRPDPMEGFLDDYAFLIRGLLDLYESSQASEWLEWAEILQEQQNRKFWDNENGGGFYSSPSSNDMSVLIRGKDDQDGAEPCGNSVSVHNLIRLSIYKTRNEWQEKSGEILQYFSKRLKQIPAALPEMVSGLMLHQKSPTHIYIAGIADDTSTKALIDIVRSHWIPGRLLTVVLSNDETTKESLSFKMINGLATAYICRNFTCHLPITCPDALNKFLDGLFEN